MRVKPARPEQFEMRRQRFASGVIFKANVPVIQAAECEMLLSAFYGGDFKAAFAMLGHAFDQWLSRACTWVLLWITDHAGWTVVHFIPETEQFRAHHQRHGRKCSGSPNCRNINCIFDSLPAWFRFITRWDKL